MRWQHDRPSAGAAALAAAAAPARGGGGGGGAGGGGGGGRGAGPPAGVPPPPQYYAAPAMLGGPLPSPGRPVVQGEWVLPQAPPERAGTLRLPRGYP